MKLKNLARLEKLKGKKKVKERAKRGTAKTGGNYEERI